MKKILTAVALAVLSASASYADAEKFYQEIDEWVFTPCMDVRVGLDASEIGEDLFEYGANLSTFSVMLKAEKLDAMKEMAESMDAGSAWKTRAEFYEQLLRICVQSAVENDQ